jgi:hypothetical protein
MKRAKAGFQVAVVVALTALFFIALMLWWPR